MTRARHFNPCLRMRPHLGDHPGARDAGADVGALVDVIWRLAADVRQQLGLPCHR
jgi:hypothetical protein